MAACVECSCRLRSPIRSDRRALYSVFCLPLRIRFGKEGHALKIDCLCYASQGKIAKPEVTCKRQLMMLVRRAVTQ